MKRRDFFKKAGIGSATLMSFPALAHALTRPAGAPSPLGSGGALGDAFVILLSGPYKPVGKCPNLGLSQVNVCDSSFSTTKIYPVSGLPVGESGQINPGNRPDVSHCETENAIGNFYVQFVGAYCAYDLPGGALTMVFTTNNLVPIPDGLGGTYFVGTLELDITEATGIYQSFVGGHNTMVDILRQLSDGTFVEHCFCNISRS